MKNLALVLITFVCVSLVSQLAPATALAAACPTSDTAKSSQDQIKVGIGATGSDCSGSGVTDFLRTIVNILGIVAGIAAIIMIIVSGFRYITSGGDSNKVSSAKSALIYALIGLVIVALSQFLVHFVLRTAGDSTCPAGQHLNQDATACVK